MHRAARPRRRSPAVEGRSRRPVELRVRPGAADSERARQRRPVPALGCAARVVARRCRDAIRTARGLRRRAGHRHDPWRLTGATAALLASASSARCPSCYSSLRCRPSSDCRARSGGVAFIFVGNAVSGGSVPIGFLPDGFRQIAPWLPNNAIVYGVRDVVYFNGHDLAHALLVLGLWPVVAFSVLALVDFLHLSERRHRPHPSREIYRTPAVVHLRQRLRQRGLSARHAT